MEGAVSDGMVCEHCRSLLKREPASPADRVTIRSVLAATADHYGVAVGQILSPIRDKHISRARAVAMYLSRLLTSASYPKLAREFGRHHTSIMAAVDKVQLMTLSNERVRDDVLAIEYRIASAAAGPDSPTVPEVRP